MSTLYGQLFNQMNSFLMFFICLFILSNSSFSQSKKEIIQQLKVQHDTLLNSISVNRNTQNETINELNLRKSELELKEDSLEREIRKYNNILEKDKFRLLSNYYKINQLTSEQIQLQDSISYLMYFNTNYFPENNFSVIKNKITPNSKKDISGVINWLTPIILSFEEVIDTSIFTINCLNYVNDVIDFNWGYNESIDENYMKKKWEKHYDLRLAKFGHLFEIGNGGWGDKEIAKFEYLGELNNGDWFKVSVSGGCCKGNKLDENLIRIIKVININNKFYFDNFLSLSEQ